MSAVLLGGWVADQALILFAVVSTTASSVHGKQLSCFLQCEQGATGRGNERLLQTETWVLMASQKAAQRLRSQAVLEGLHSLQKSVAQECCWILTTECLYQLWLFLEKCD